MNIAFKRFWLSCLLGGLILTLTNGLSAQFAMEQGNTSSTNPAAGSDKEYHDLGCGGQRWTGYFAASRWDRDEVTGASVPGSQLTPKGMVEKTVPVTYRIDERGVHFPENRGNAQTWSIEIPAAGYLSFRVEPILRNALTAVRVRINGREVAQELPADGYYYSPYLRAGDRFTLLIPPGTVAYDWTDLIYHGNYSAVVVSLDEVLPNRRYYPIEGARLRRVSFPPTGGWPVYDLDGDPITIDDCTELRETTPYFDVRYEDEVKPARDGKPAGLYRTFHIREVCGGGNELRRTVRWSDLPLIPVE